MNEITVVTDVRPSPDSADLLLVRQKFAVVDGTLRAVGDPSEEKMPLATRRATITLSAELDDLTGLGIIAHVKNIGLAPLKITRVEFEYKLDVTQPRPETWPASVYSKPVGRIKLLPHAQKNTPLLPNETREWLLPVDYYGNTFEELGRLSPTEYKIVAYVGKDSIAEATGEEFQSQFDAGLDLYKSTSGIKITPYLRHMMIDLSTEVKTGVMNAVLSLQQQPTEEWVNIPGVTPIGGRQYFVNVPPEYRARVRRLKPGVVQIVDVFRYSKQTENLAALVQRCRQDERLRANLLRLLIMQI